MHLHHLPLAQTRRFSALLSEYLSQKPALQPLYHHFPDLAGFTKQLSEASFEPEKREILHQVLTEQYAGYTRFPEANITALRDANTFMVTTGHQLNIFSGPLYVIYKLITTINLAHYLKSQFPDYQFVPVYWLASEDHDFEEINHFDLFGKKYTWETTQTGAVGRMNPHAISAILSQLPEKTALFEEAYTKHNTLADATRYWVNELFGQDGLICIDADHPRLKAQFRDVIQADVLQNEVLPLFENQTRQLEQLGYERQINGRDINFFFLENNRRERIVKTESGYQVLNTELVFSEEEIRKMIAENPEKFSPNVLLRPVYQQVILPNLAYIGGPAEVVYWFQLKRIFEHFGVLYPIVMPRNFGLYVNKATSKKLEKLGVTPAELFADEAEIKREFVTRNTENPLDTEAEKQKMNEIFESLIEKALQTDASLEGFVKAERQKAMASLENVEKRLKKAEEQKQSVQLNQLLGVRQKLFPEGGLQERNDNFLNFYLNNPQFLETLKAHFNPLDFSFNIFTEE